MSGRALALFRRLAAPVGRRLGSSGAGQEPAKGWWHSATFWGGWGAAAGWGMTGSAIYDANLKGPEIISLNMTSVMLVYSSLFARWAWVVKPQNLALCACHVSNVIAQSNQMRRAIEYKLSKGQDKEVQEMGQKAAIGAASMAALIVGGPTIQGAIVGAGLGPVRCVFTCAVLPTQSTGITDGPVWASTFAGAAAGPFTVHFWAPMSKWLISGASFLDLNRPTELVSITQVCAQAHARASHKLCTDYQPASHLLLRRYGG